MSTSLSNVQKVRNSTLELCIACSTSRYSGKPVVMKNNADLTVKSALCTVHYLAVQSDYIIVHMWFHVPGSPYNNRYLTTAHPLYTKWRGVTAPLPPYSYPVRDIKFCWLWGSGWLVVPLVLVSKSITILCHLSLHHMHWYNNITQWNYTLWVTVLRHNVHNSTKSS